MCYVKRQTLIFDELSLFVTLHFVFDRKHWFITVVVLSYLLITWHYFFSVDSWMSSEEICSKECRRLLWQICT